MSTSRVLVVGLGKTGQSIAAYLKRCHQDFILYDTRAVYPPAQTLAHTFNVPLYLADFPEQLWQDISEVIVSPGVPLDAAIVSAAIARKIPICGDIECFAREVKAPVIAITGTNGKSTVTSLVAEMAEVSGRRVAIAGNIGIPVLDRLADAASYDLWVLELSSFQLDLTYSLAPIAATILNVSPDHLDRHHTLDAYIHAKQQIYSAAAVQIFARIDLSTYPQCDTGRRLSFGLDAPAAHEWGILCVEGQDYFAHGQEPLMPTHQMSLKGRHNCLNALAAAALAYEAGIDKQSIIHVLQTFSGLSHRCQWIRQLAGVDWIDDSKGTNVGATLSAILGMANDIDGKIVLIAGGQGKDADFTSLRQVVREHVRALVLIGEDSAKIAQALEGAAPCYFADSMMTAVSHSQALALSGDTVLLSPACASFDMFRDYNHRGDVFSQLVQDL